MGKKNNYRLGKYIAIYSNCVSTQEQQEKNVSCFPGCTVIGVPEQACASLTERVLQAVHSPCAASKMLFYSKRRLITQCNIPNGSFVQFFFLFSTPSLLPNLLKYELCVVKLILRFYLFILF